MTLINIAKDDTKPLFIDPSDITALAFYPPDDLLMIYDSKGIKHQFGKLNSCNLDVADVVQKLTNNGASFLPFTMRHEGKEYPHFITPQAVTFVTSSIPGQNGMVGAIIGVKGAGRVESWEGGSTPEEIQALVDGVQKTKPLLQYKPEEAYARFSRSAALYIDPTSVTRMQGSFGQSQIDVFFENSGRLDVQVAYDNEYSPEFSLRQKACDILNAEYAAGRQDTRSPNEVHEQLKKEVFQKRVDFTNAIAAANSALINFSTTSQAAFLRREDIKMVSLHEGDSGALSLCVWSREREPMLGDLHLDFNTAAERQATLAILQKAAPAPAPNTKTTPKP